jgi:hypothetical protein
MLESIRIASQQLKLYQQIAQRHISFDILNMYHPRFRLWSTIVLSLPLPARQDCALHLTELTGSASQSCTTVCVCVCVCVLAHGRSVESTNKVQHHEQCSIDD